jgi:hypothetical protein
VATATFDTHKAVRSMEAAGMPTSQAEAIMNALKEAQENAELVTRKDLEISLSPIRSTLRLHSWMLTFVFGGVLALVLKTFFGG